jgi:hypothetical protein
MWLLRARRSHRLRLLHAGRSHQLRLLHVVRRRREMRSGHHRRAHCRQAHHHPRPFTRSGEPEEEVTVTLTSIWSGIVKSVSVTDDRSKNKPMANERRSRVMGASRQENTLEW